MKAIWSDNAKESYFRTLGYWIKHNVSRTFSDKITMEVNVLLAELEQKPYFLAKYSENLNLYKRSIMRGRFVVYYSIDEFNGIVEFSTSGVHGRYLCNNKNVNNQNR